METLKFRCLIIEHLVVLDSIFDLVIVLVPPMQRNFMYLTEPRVVILHFYLVLKEYMVVLVIQR